MPKCLCAKILHRHTVRGSVRKCLVAKGIVFRMSDLQVGTFTPVRAKVVQTACKILLLLTWKQVILSVGGIMLRAWL